MRNKKSLPILAIILLLVGLFSGCAAQDPGQAIQAVHSIASELTDQLENDAKTPEGSDSSQTEAPSIEGDLRVHFIDVGQGDSILIQSDTQAVLVDGGTASAGQTVIDYIHAQGIAKLDAVVATHPHEDHIGGLVPVMKGIPVDNFYMPNKAHTTKTFENLITAVNQSGAKRIQAKAGVSIPLDGVWAEFLAPNSDSYDSLNNYSAVLKVTHGQNSFLLTGDAETTSEFEMLAAGHDLKANVLKVGHHGSSTSTSGAFLDAVAPEVAVISCGRDNQYGHPHWEAMSKLGKAGIEIYRTDTDGTVVAASNGQKIIMGDE